MLPFGDLEFEQSTETVTLVGQIVIYANPGILGGLFANGKDRGRCLPMHKVTLQVTVL